MSDSNSTTPVPADKPAEADKPYPEAIHFAHERNLEVGALVRAEQLCGPTRMASCAIGGGFP